jgi:hypothetical protein
MLANIDKTLVDIVTIDYTSEISTTAIINRINKRNKVLPFFSCN